MPGTRARGRSVAPASRRLLGREGGWRTGREVRRPRTKWAPGPPPSLLPRGLRGLLESRPPGRAADSGIRFPGPAAAGRGGSPAPDRLWYFLSRSNWVSSCWKFSFASFSRLRQSAERQCLRGRILWKTSPLLHPLLFLFLKEKVWGYGEAKSFGGYSVCAGLGLGMKF